MDGLHAELPLSEAAARTVSVRTREVFEHLARDGGRPDADAVHDARVATRRLRAALEIYAPCFPRKGLKPALRDVKALADALGARRDPDVQLLALERFGATAKEADWPGVEALADRIRAEQQAGDAVLTQAVADATQSGLRERLLALVEAS